MGKTGEKETTESLLDSDWCSGESSGTGGRKKSSIGALQARMLRETHEY